MRYTTRSVGVVVAAVLLHGAPAAAQLSHQGQETSEHVVLRDANLAGRVESECAGNFKSRALFRVLPDGTRASDPFVVPPARHLVITDVEWTVDALATGGPPLAGETVRTRILIGSGATFNTVFLSRSVEVGPERGAVSGSDQLATGFVVGSNTTICPSGAEFGGNVIRTVRLLEIVLRGYLINATH